MLNVDINYILESSIINQIKSKYPDFKTIESNSSKGVFYSKHYRDFHADFCASFLSPLSFGVNIYDKEGFQYSISTGSGKLNEKLKYLEEIVDSIDNKGFSFVRKRFYTEDIKMSFDKF